MLLNYIKITLRNLYKEKMYAVINISGLSLGIACCIILGLYLRSELTYDQHNLKHKRIFRLQAEGYSNGKVISENTAPLGGGPLLAKDYPQVEAYVRFRYMKRTLFRHEDKSFYWDSDSICVTDKNVFDVFTHKIIYGNPETALSEPYSMAVSESFSKKYFGDANPVGKIIFDYDTPYKITLVFADLPENSHLRYDVLLSFEKLMDDKALLDSLNSGYPYLTYLLMKEGYQAGSFQDIAESFCERYLKNRMESLGFTIKLWLQPLADIHLRSDTKIKFHIYGLSAVAIFILLVACINYMNLATARFMKRGREAGMRKVLGATRLQLIAQFLGESVFFALISLVIGLVLVEVLTAITSIKELLGKQEIMNLHNDPVMLLWMLGFTLVVGLISGIYPAFYLSSALPVSTLNGTTRSGKKGLRVRQILVLIQFIISIAVIASTILMARQMRYVAEKPLGLIKENQVLITMHGVDLVKKVPVLKHELLKDTRILGLSATMQMVTGTALDNIFIVENNEGVMEEQSHIMGMMWVGEDFIKVMGIELIEGNNFSHEQWRSDNGRHVLVNETLVKSMGWKEPLGKRMLLGNIQFSVVGVVKDFHFRSLHQKLEPLVLMTWPANQNFSHWSATEKAKYSRLLVVNITGEDIPGTLNYIRAVFKEFDPEDPFEYRFLDDELDELYRSEQHLMKLTGIFSGICILISCLGLFGLAAFTTEQRTKEIGVRKVLGASTFQIIVMLSRGILLIILAASVVASLIAYFVIDEWLAGFAYHTGINPLVFVLSAAIAMAVAFGTVALQSFKTAQENPVKALRYE